MTYQVKLDVFEGPFDLLLHLIAKRELDIYEISLAQITEDYLGYLQAMSDLDLEIATEFLVVAATLVEMKAARLLPGPPVDDEDALAISERDMLIARLLEYSAFKDASGTLRALFDANAPYIAREAGPGREFAYLCPDILSRVSLERFRELAIAALAPKPPPPALDTSHITPIRVSVSDAIAALRDALRANAFSSFRDLTSDCGSRIEVIVRFLALLELIRRGQADVAQAQAFGDIEVRRLDGPDTDDGDAVIVVDEYDGTMVEEADTVVDLAALERADAPGEES